MLGPRVCATPHAAASWRSDHARASWAGATFEIRPLAHMLVQPDFSSFFTTSVIYHTPRDTALCCRTPATHPSISRFGPPRRTTRATQLRFCKFRLGEAPTTACLSDRTPFGYLSPNQWHIPHPQGLPTVLSYTSHTPLHFPIRAAPGPGVQRNSGSVNFG